MSCHAVLCRVVCLVWALIEHKCRQFTWNICTVLITRGNFKIDSVLFAQHSNEQVLCQRPKSTADVTWSASVCAYVCVSVCGVPKLRFINPSALFCGPLLKHFAGTICMWVQQTHKSCAESCLVYWIINVRVCCVSMYACVCVLGVAVAVCVRDIVWHKTKRNIKHVRRHLCK